MDILVHKIMNMYVHVCTMFRHVYTVLPYPVQGGRIPDGWYEGLVLPSTVSFRVTGLSCTACYCLLL